MLDALLQLKKAYEDEGMTLEEIAADQELDIAAVKAGLMQVSASYRKECGVEQKSGETVTENSCNFTEEQLAAVTREIYDLAMDGDNDPHLRAKLLMYVRNDAKGRLNPVKNVQQSGVNILQINMALQQARVGAQQAKKLIDA